MCILPCCPVSLLFCLTVLHASSGEGGRIEVAGRELRAEVVPQGIAIAPAGAARARARVLFMQGQRDPGLPNLGREDLTKVTEQRLEQMKERYQAEFDRIMEQREQSREASETLGELVGLLLKIHVEPVGGQPKTAIREKAEEMIQVLSIYLIQCTIKINENMNALRGRTQQVEASLRAIEAEQLRRILE